MSKVSDSYQSVIRGVSEQVPHERYPGQHWAQDNMVSDPVAGLVRRAGSVLKWSMPATATPDLVTQQDYSAFRERSMYLGADEFSFMYRGHSRPVGSTAVGVHVVNKTKRKILTTAVHGTVAADVLAGGVSAITSAGRYVLLSSATRPAEHTVENALVPANLATTRGTVFIRVGNYSRKYTVVIIRATDGVRFEGTYTTPSSYYQGVLDTSDIPLTIPDPANPTGPQIPNPNYSKLVLDRTNAYNSAVNAWIGTAAAAIIPANIAQKLVESLYAAGMDFSVGRVENTIIITNVSFASVTDSGDNSSVGAVVNEVESLNQLSVIHVPGKVVKITPKGSATGSYYVKARGAAGETDGSGWVQVIWEESAGIIVKPGFMMCIGALVGDVFHIAGSPAELQAAIGGTVPDWQPSSSGDLESQPLPAMFGSGLPITHMRVFQDRLMIVSGSTVFLSRTGDYFNLFKTSALSVINDDPVEVYALGSEDDVITDSELLDRDLLLFGNVWQYAMSGRDALTPNNAYISIQSSYPESNRCSPAGAGGFIFYAQPRDFKLTVQQMQTGNYAGTTTSFEVTQQLSSYLKGAPLQMVSTTSPSTMFLRTNGLTHGVYVYSYLDAPGQAERLFDAWHRWTWSAGMGAPIGICGKDGALLLLSLRDLGGAGHLVLDEFTLSPGSEEPCLDSRRPISTPYELAVGSPLSQYASVVIGASGGSFNLVGKPLDEQADFVASFPEQVANMVAGYDFDSEVVLTNPYVRDQKDRAILDARLNLSRYIVSLTSSAALRAIVQDLETLDHEETEALNWVARPSGSWVLNTQQVEQDFNVTIGVYKEIRNCKVALRSRSWLPMGITAIEWSGQFFTRR